MEEMFIDLDSNEDEIKSWKILIADDELDVHTITKLALNKVTFLGKPLEFLSAYSGAETCKIMKENPDIALILLDVIMESDTSGFEVVKFIREELHNCAVRIIFRTGIPGSAPERKIIDDYDINDYKEKTELTATKLYTTIITGLRNYKDILITQQNKCKTEKIMQYFRHVIESMLSGVTVINSDYKIEICTHQMLDLISPETASNVSGTNIFESLPFFGKYKKEIDAVLEKQCRLEKMIIPACNGKIVNLVFCPLNEMNDHVVIRIDDVTALIEKEHQLVHLQKLEMVGMLAAGITHDFNNILGSISGTVSLMQLEGQKNGDTVLINAQNYDEYLNLISKAVSRAAELSKKLISISKENVPEMECVDLKDIVNAAVNMCKASIAKCVKIKTVFRCGQAKIKGDSNSLEQMLLNLCINASHAMTIMRSNDKSEWGGTLTITVDLCDTPQKLELKTEKCYVLSVSDTGVGMSEETKEKLFNPFFSTKRKDEGTGLGLLMVHNIVNIHGGFLEVESSPGKGTDFRIFLPVFEGAD